MIVEFYKYQGTGNDFIMIDDRQESFPIENNKLIQSLCERRFGIGADGLILLRNHEEVDFQMIYFNADGNESTMCGNGGRCIVAFAKFIGVIENSATFMAIDGLHNASINGNLVSLGMKDVERIEEHIELPFADTGSPHLVKEVTDVNQIDVDKEGRKLRENHSREGTNVNFVAWESDTLNVRTYERGVEAETFSCGTGVTASAIIMKRNAEQGIHEVKIKSLGGYLSVSFEKLSNGFKNIRLVGPATSVFKGSFSC